ncbi:MAG: class I SAM-dependent methyltransferase, partial [Deltaproteobacteria bacterium]|nr:class I SAM-dependent methyltransferase [Candidatus Tharpella aukensis]
EFKADKPPCTEPCEALCATGYNSLHAGDLTSAKDFFERAVALDPDYVHSYMGLAKVRMPGDGYIEIIKKLIALLKPEKYVEIGVEKGAVLRLFDASVQIVGVDPEPKIDVVPENVKLYKKLSDDFFAAHNLELLLDGSFDLAFIDGLHIYEQVLKDFINLEKIAAPDSIIMIHDCLPLDRRTSERQRKTIFWSGDVWKIIPCLKQERPDLSIFTVPTYPAGLCFVTGLDCHSRLLKNNYDAIVERYSQLDYSDIQERETYFSMTANDWPTINQTLSDNLARTKK